MKLGGFRDGDDPWFSRQYPRERDLRRGPLPLAMCSIASSTGWLAFLFSALSRADAKVEVTTLNSQRGRAAHAHRRVERQTTAGLVDSPLAGHLFVW
jgi:hypothetical protein